jgi:hypothetical protein
LTYIKIVGSAAVTSVLPLDFTAWRTIMSNRATSDANAGGLGAGSAQFLQFGKERSDAMLKVHKEVLDAYQEASQAWVSRVKSEVEFWSELANKLATSRSVPEGMETYRDGISHRMQMAAEDGQRMFEDGQKMIAAVTKSLSGGLSAAGK